MRVPTLIDCLSESQPLSLSTMELDKALYAQNKLTRVSLENKHRILRFIENIAVSPHFIGVLREVNANPEGKK